MKYGITSDMILVRGYTTDQPYTLISNDKEYYVKATFDEYSDAMAALMNDYASWVERTARTHKSILTSISNAIAMKP
mgnify:CR=1 FL=1